MPLPATDAVSILVEPHPAGVIVHVRGYLGTAETEALDRALNGVIASRPGRVAVELSGVDLLASLAMGALVKLQRATSMYGGRTILVGAQPTVLSSLKRARLDALIPMVATIDEAMA